MKTRLAVLLFAALFYQTASAQLVVSGGSARSIVMSGTGPARPAAVTTGTDANESLPVVQDIFAEADPDLQPCPPEVAAVALSLLDLSESDLLADIGCGDGRQLITAVRQYGCRGLGIEINASRADAARDAVEAAGLSDRIEIITGDARRIDVSDADAVFLYHFPRELEWLGPMVAGKRVVSAFHELPDRSDGQKVGDVWLYQPKPVTSTAQQVVTVYVSPNYCNPCERLKAALQSSTISGRVRYVTGGAASYPTTKYTKPDGSTITLSGYSPGTVDRIERDLSGTTTSRTVTTTTQSVAVWQGVRYSAPVCSSRGCTMCNSIRRQLGLR